MPECTGRSYRLNRRTHVVRACRRRILVSSCEGGRRRGRRHHSRRRVHAGTLVSPLPFVPNSTSTCTSSPFTRDLVNALRFIRCARARSGSGGEPVEPVDVSRDDYEGAVARSKTAMWFLGGELGRGQWRMPLPRGHGAGDDTSVPGPHTWPLAPRARGCSSITWLERGGSDETGETRRLPSGPWPWTP